VWHRYRPARDARWETRWIGFNGRYANMLVENGLLSVASPVLRIGIQSGAIEAHQRLLDLVSEDAAGNPHRLAAAAMEVLAWILAPTQAETPQPASRPFAQPVLDRFVAEAVRLIWTQGQHAMSVSEVAAHFPVTRRSLERRFQRALGHTILDEIIRCRLERAKRLLLETDQSLKAVALAAGFSNARHMCRVFHRAEKVTPASYRRQAK
jgi:transcriptional regulator GlxA family with amidase domain